MAKKPNNIVEMTQSDADPDDGLQAPATPPVMNWPMAEEKKYLRCELDDKDRLKYCGESAALVETINQLEDQKKASASQYKAAIEEKQARLSRISGVIRSGWEERETECQWMYETAGIDANGMPIFHPEKKTLVRNDTLTVVEIRDITSEERQMALPLEEEPQNEEDGE